MLTREEKARQLLHAMTEIEDRYIAEAAPENTEHSAASEEAVEAATVVQMKHADVEKTKMDAQEDAKESAKTDVPDEDHHSEPKVLYMKQQKRWKPVGIIAAAAVLVIGFGAYIRTEKASDSMAPVAFVTGADSSSEAAENEKEMAAEAAPYSDELSGAAENRARTKSAMTETDAAPEAGSSDAAMGMQIANPWSDFDTLEEAEADADVELALPESYQHFDHRIYRAMHGEMIEVIYQDADGQEGFRIRKSRNTGDVSGDYNSYAQKKTLEIGDRSVVTRGNGDEISVATWTNLSQNLSYAICVAEEQHFTEDDIRSLVKTIA